MLSKCACVVLTSLAVLKAVRREQHPRGCLEHMQSAEGIWLTCLFLVQGEKKIKTTVLTAALLLSGIPAEVINRSMDTYSKMGEVFTDLCVYFFTFIFCHELLDYWGSEVP